MPGSELTLAWRWWSGSSSPALSPALSWPAGQLALVFLDSGCFTCSCILPSWVPSVLFLRLLRDWTKDWSDFSQSTSWWGLWRERARGPFTFWRPQGLDCRGLGIGAVLNTPAKGARAPPPPIRLFSGREERFLQRRRNICSCQRPVAAALCTVKVCLGAAICLASREHGSSL